MENWFPEKLQALLYKAVYLYFRLLSILSPPADIVIGGNAIPQLDHGLTCHQQGNYAQEEKRCSK